jgi:hypothetical protein
MIRECNNRTKVYSSLLGNGLVKEFPRTEILGKESIARLRNNRGGCVFYVIRATPSTSDGSMNSQSDMTRVLCGVRDGGLQEVPG